MRNSLLLVAGLICLAAGIKLAYIERGYFAIGPEYLFLFIPVLVDYIYQKY